MASKIGTVMLSMDILNIFEQAFMLCNIFKAVETELIFAGKICLVG